VPVDVSHAPRGALIVPVIAVPLTYHACEAVLEKTLRDVTEKVYVLFCSTLTSWQMNSLLPLVEELATRKFPSPVKLKKLPCNNLGFVVTPA
jgi:hypothetical protein